MSPRAEITFHCIMMAIWIYLGIYAFDKAYNAGNNRYWGLLFFACAWTGMEWKNIWREYDRAKGKGGNDYDDLI